MVSTWTSGPSHQRSAEVGERLCLLAPRTRAAAPRGIKFPISVLPIQRSRDRSNLAGVPEGPLRHPEAAGQDYSLPLLGPTAVARTSSIIITDGPLLSIPRPKLSPFGRQEVSTAWTRKLSFSKGLWADPL